MRILILGQPPRPCLSALRDAGFLTDFAADAEEADFMCETGAHGALAMTLTPGAGARRALLRGLMARRCQTPALVLAEARDRAAAVACLRDGAEDFMLLPAPAAEFAARIEAMLRRRFAQPGRRRLHGAVSVERPNGPISVAGRRVELTLNERRAVGYLSLRAGAVIGKSELAEQVYENFDFDSNVIEALISRIRAKLGEGLIRTVRGHGYLIEAV